MTGRHSPATKPRFVLLDPPEREPEDMSCFDPLTKNGCYHLV